jgi:hypothetical protein
VRLRLEHAARVDRAELADAAVGGHHERARIGSSGRAPGFSARVKYALKVRVVLALRARGLGDFDRVDLRHEGDQRVLETARSASASRHRSAS